MKHNKIKYKKTLYRFKYYQLVDLFKLTFGFKLDKKIPRLEIGRGISN